MRYALISDIHGNREALDAVLDDIDRKEIDRIICLGDIVGYGADPNYCVERIREVADIVIVGNHDHAAIGLTSTAYFNVYAQEAARWTARTLTKENEEYLRSLEFTHIENDILFVHSTPYQPELWGYVLSPWEAELQFSQFSEKICFIGHSHIPAEYKEPGTARRIINVGSVGQPRDNDPRSCCYIYDNDADSGRWIRVEYTFNITARRIIEAGLPPALAERLRWGR